MIFHNLLGSILYHVVTCVVIASMLGSMVPIIRDLPQATAAYLGMMDQLGLLKSNSNSPLGVQPVALEGVEGISPAIGPDGEPVGFLLSASAFDFEGQASESPELANPISISRVQSAYACTDALSDTLLITFTVTNNRPPAVVPSIPVSGTITDTVEIASTFDFSNDPHVLHNVLLVDALESASATLISVSPRPDRDGDSLAWNLGDISPLESVTATLTVQIPASVSTFTKLDGGATAWGTLQGNEVSASAAPAMLAPDAVGDWLMWTVDADYYDKYLVAQSATLSNEPEQMFDYVRSLKYESYKGSLRGTRGTLWSGAGNSMDQASLLIAMLRGSGIPARYRHGALAPEQAQELILSMFTEPQGTIGHVSPDADVADPANNPQLMAETIDHWWVEAYLPGQGWTDLDPCFAEALPGQTFHDTLATDGTDRIPEVSDDQRHKVTMRVKVERWDMLSSLSGGLGYSYPLSHTFNTVELVGESVTLGHLVNSYVPPAMIFWRVDHTYVPYFTAGDSETVIEGEAFQDVLSNFPFGNFVTTAEWLLFDVRDADGNVEHYEREVVDRVGFENRQSGGRVDISEDIGMEPLFSPADHYTAVFGQSLYAIQGVFSLVQEQGRQLPRLQELNQRYERAYENDPDSADTSAAERDLVNAFNRFVRLNHHFLAGLHYGTVDELVGAYSRGFLTAMYPDSPRIVIVSTSVQSDDLQMSIDLLRTDVRTLVAPGQVASVAQLIQVYYGFTNSLIEDIVLDAFLSTFVDQSASSSSISASKVFAAAEESGVDTVILLPDDLDQLEELTISNEAKARIKAALSVGKLVWVPVSMVPLDGEPQISWYEIDPLSGRTISVNENGYHGVVETAWHYVKTTWWFGLLKFITGLIGGFLVSYMFTYSAFSEILGPFWNWFLPGTGNASGFWFVVKGFLSLIGLKLATKIPLAPAEALNMIFKAMAEKMALALEAKSVSEFLWNITAGVKAGAAACALHPGVCGFAMGFGLGLIAGGVCTYNDSAGANDTIKFICFKPGKALIIVEASADEVYGPADVKLTGETWRKWSGETPEWRWMEEARDDKYKPDCGPSPLTYNQSRKRWISERQCMFPFPNPPAEVVEYKIEGEATFPGETNLYAESVVQDSVVFTIKKSPTIIEARCSHRASAQDYNAQTGYWETAFGCATPEIGMCDGCAAEWTWVVEAEWPGRKPNEPNSWESASPDGNEISAIPWVDFTTCKITLDVTAKKGGVDVGSATKEIDCPSLPPARPTPTPTPTPIPTWTPTPTPTPTPIASLPRTYPSAPASASVSTSLPLAAEGKSSAHKSPGMAKMLASDPSAEATSTMYQTDALTTTLLYPSIPGLVTQEYGNSGSEIAITTYQGGIDWTDDHLVADVETLHLALHGYSSAIYWQSEAHADVPYTTLIVQSATVRLPNGQLVATGKLDARSESPDSISIPEMSEYQVSAGEVYLAGYAQATSGLGATTTWYNHAITITPSSTISVTIHPSVLWIDGTAYSDGEYVVEISTPLALWYSSMAPSYLMPSFATQLQGGLISTDLHLASGTGTAAIGSTPLDVGNGIAIKGFDGVIDFTEQTTTTNRVQLDGMVDRIVLLDTTSLVDNIIPFQSAQFQIDVLSNITDTYILQVDGPPGWDVDLDSTGLVTATPGVDVAQPGEYKFFITAQSASQSDLVATTEHVVTMVSHQGVEADVSPNPYMGVPWGPRNPDALPGDTNNGQVQLPGAAFTVAITNTSTTPHTFHLDVTPTFPVDWLILSTDQVTLPAGGVGQVGLYISPTLTLPPAGTVYPFDVDVTMVEAPALSDSDSDVFIVPAIAFNYLENDPVLLYVTPDGSETFVSSITNVGNVDGEFPVSVTTPPTWTISNLQSPSPRLRPSPNPSPLPPTAPPSATRRSCA